jgi:hypothetical protein
MKLQINAHFEETLSALKHMEGGGRNTPGQDNTNNANKKSVINTKKTARIR